jgi:hypothetical protein
MMFEFPELDGTDSCNAQHWGIGSTLCQIVKNQMKIFYLKKRKKAEQRKKSGKMMKKRKLSAKSGRDGNPDYE